MPFINAMSILVCIVVVVAMIFLIIEKARD